MKKSIGLIVALVAILVGAAPLKWPSVSLSGQMASMQVERVNVTLSTSYRQDRRVLLGSEPVTADVLQQRVRQVIETSGQNQVFLIADRDITVGEAVEFMDLLKAAGAERVALISN